MILILSLCLSSLAIAEWEIISPPYVSSHWWLNAVHFTSPNEGWAVGWDYENYIPVLLHYENDSWTSIVPPNVDSEEGSEGGLAVHFTSPYEGWAVGYETYLTPGKISRRRGILLHYLNGSWANVSPPNIGPNWDLSGVHFTSSNEGWAVGRTHGGPNDHGVLLHYFNGFWTSVSPPGVSSSWGLESVHFVSSGEGWAVGYDLFGTDFSQQQGKDRGLGSMSGVERLTNQRSWLFQQTLGFPVPAQTDYRNILSSLNST